MKFVAQFDSFLSEIVNLNETRVTLLEDSIEAIKGSITASEWGPDILEFAPQGSWAHKTIIKPRTGAAFDADLLAYVKHVDGWEAKDYVNRLFSELEATGTYEDKVRRYSHCVTIEYAGERKIDIAPCVSDRIFTGSLEVCNRDTNEFERSEPKQYTDWLVQKNLITKNNNLRRVTRLLKYLRDIKTNFTCPSFLLTTLLGERVYESDRQTSLFTDLPTTLKVLVSRLDDWLQANAAIPTIRNPVLFDEIQSTAWDETKYNNFRDKVNLYREWIEDAYNEEDREESIGKWQRVFGEDFARLEASSKAASVSEFAVAMFRGNPIVSGAGDLVGLVKKLGSAAIPHWFSRLPHMHRPKWKIAPSNLTVVISAQLFRTKEGQLIGRIDSLSLAQAGFWIRFDCLNNVGLPFPTSYTVMWRVTNTDNAAHKANALRGDFYDSSNNHCRWEHLSYRGVHIVEAFLIRKIDRAQFGRSDPFYVVVE